MSALNLAVFSGRKYLLKKAL